MIHITSAHSDGVDQDDSDNDDRVIFAHMATLENDDVQTSFVAQLQNVAFSYAKTATIPCLRFGATFKGILTDVGAAKRSMF